MIHNNQRMLALAGIMQSCTLINHIARGRWVDPQTVDISIESIFVLEPDDVLSVFQGKTANLEFGLRRLTTFFPKPERKHDAEVASYLFGSILLARLLQQDKARMAKLGEAIEAVNAKRRNDPEMDTDDIAAELAQLYVEYIGSFKRRINLVGSKEILQDPLEVNRLRTLLLAAVRAAILWNQVGGRLWQLWWKRPHIADHAKALLAKL